MHDFVNPTDETAFADLISNINNGIAETQSSLDECAKDYNNRKDHIDWWHAFLDWFARQMEKVGQELEKAIAKFVEFCETIADYMSPGNPFAMFAKSNEWATIKRKITSTKSLVTSDYLRADDTWKGDPGDGYSDLAGRQRMAMDTLAGYTDSMISFLSDYGTKILDAWIEFGATLITYFLDQIDAGASFITADPLEWLDAVPKIVQLCTNLARTAVSLTEQLAGNFTSSNRMSLQLTQDMSDLSGFPTGSWPSAQIV
ncbi:hypothetical protein ET445_05515 [Agromyces protaetiae]|uniref:Uncharacterized protein n=1 Tax=Agromyces protaetiae TaxID=2509455 RepID=A0A4P6FET0_9MICO|nr:hypothetical protein [Agromyces protaetiae]QAY72879.1 hypothetical protein ET445_05515 [Agromyces protaetiae]